ncbi:MAG: hypothetical protein FWC26_07885 [Fibromonadales bacterium]|nr:hypothetical protein [Fibromonadales bacterium]
MKKIVVLLALLCAVALAQNGKTKVAVYVTGGNTDGENRALGTKILAALVNSGRYETIERSQNFLEEIAKEQKKQRSGAIDDSQISALGKQFGVQFVCIADITEAFGSYQVSARMVNIETAVVIAIGEADSPLKSMSDLTEVSNKVVESMLGIKTAKPATQAAAQVTAQAVAQEVANSAPNSFVDSRDGKKYRVVEIGGQVWMAENIGYSVGANKCYNNNQSYCNAYGMLYNWETARSVCPDGWHLPSDAEWMKLTNFAGGVSMAGAKLKAKSGWSGSGNGTDNYGFSAMPGGDASSSGVFNNAGNFGRWWSATESNSNYAYYRNMAYHGNGIDRYDYSKYNMLSVRCVRD